MGDLRVIAKLRSHQTPRMGCEEGRQQDSHSFPIGTTNKNEETKEILCSLSKFISYNQAVSRLNKKRVCIGCRRFLHLDAMSSYLSQGRYGRPLRSQPRQMRCLVKLLT